MRHQQLLANLGVVLALGVGAAAEQGGGAIRRQEPPRPRPEIERSAVNFVPTNATGATRVIGSVIDIRQIPVGGVTVQLHNLDTGNVEQQIETDEKGEYQFVLEESGSYIVEMKMVDGYVIALSNAGSVARSQTLQTVVQLPGRWDFAGRRLVAQSSLTSYFGMSAETTMTATTIQIAVARDVKPADPGIPVSP